jgi:hypothetical protein
MKHFPLGLHSTTHLHFLTHTQEPKEVKNIPYQSRVGSSMYCMVYMYLDITFTIGAWYVFQFFIKLMKTH